MPHAHVRGRVAIGVAALSALSVLGTTAPLAGLTGLVAPASAASAAATADDTADIADRIKAIPGVSSVTEAAAPAGYRFFKITFTQPVDHKDPSKGTFEQRLTLLHKDTSRPMVMYTGGYYVSQSPSRSEPTQIVDGNQLSMEYRFFEPSRPSNPDWEKELTIWQAATDQHRIIEAFKSVYDQHWITTGGSKGGMTATYHRRFYPDDVNGTVPYVAPNDVKDDKDAYNAWLAGVGNDQGCRDTLIGLERRVLGRDREWFSQKVADVSAANGYTYDIVGDREKAMEAGVVDAYWAFWQYSSQADCADLPDPATATNDEVWNWFEQVSPLTVYADQSVSYYTPYYFQAAYQLGGPEPYEDRISDLLRFPGADVPMTFVPDEIKPSRFDKQAMGDVDRWVRTKSTQMLYVYGGNDPWGVEAFTCGARAAQRDCSRYYVAGGNHGSRISMLPEAEKQAATSRVLAWAGLAPSDPAVRQVKAHGHPSRNARLDVTPDYLRRHPGL